MHYLDFRKFVDPFALVKKDFGRVVGQQLRDLKITPSKYEKMLPFAGLETNVNPETDDLEEIIKRFYAGRGDLCWPMSFYFLYHNSEPLFPAAKNVDRYLFDGRTFREKFEDETDQELPSFTKTAPKLKTARNRITRAVEVGKESPTDTLRRVLDSLIGQPHIHDFLLKLDWSEKEGAYKFDADAHHEDPDEKALDYVLYHLSLAGGILRRGELGLRDAALIRTWVEIVMGNKEVHAFLKWIHRPDQLPNHVDFVDAVYLYETMIGNEVPELTKYRLRAEEVLAKRSGD